MDDSIDALFLIYYTNKSNLQKMLYYKNCCHEIDVARIKKEQYKNNVNLE